MRIQSSGIPAHSYGKGNSSWADRVIDQKWDVAIPLVSEKAKYIARGVVGQHVDPAEFLLTAARENQPIGMALNGVPFFSPLTAEGEVTP